MRQLRTGDWLTETRVRTYAWMVLVLGAIALAALVLTAEGGLDVQGRPLGTDFSNVWSAGTLVLDGTPQNAYDPHLHYLSQQAAFGSPDVPFYGWHYPPFFLSLAAALALLPYGWALLAWMALTFPAYLATIHAIVRASFASTPPSSLTLLVASAYPAVAVNLMHGQNGFASAALLGAGLVALDRRPVLAGLAIGLLAYKPHFGVLLPLVLAATGRWKAFAAASLTVGALVAVTTLVFGVEIWSAFLVSTTFTREAVLESGALGWEKLQSLFAALSALGVPLQWAYGAQGLLAAIVAVVTIRVWRSPVALAVKSALLAVATVLVTPYAMDYDLMIIALSLAWMTGHGLKHGFLGWEKTVLAAAWAVPLLTRPVAVLTLVPLGWLVMVALFAIIVRRARHDVANKIQ